MKSPFPSRFRLVLLCFGFGLAAGLAGAWWQGPDVYRSTAVVRMSPPILGDSKERDLAEHINAIAQTALSPANLSALLTRVNLYPQERLRLPMEECVERLKRDAIRINSIRQLEGVHAPTAFQVTFRYPDPVLAQKAAEAVVAGILREAVAERARIAHQVTLAMREQAEAAATDLDRIQQATGVPLERKAADLAMARQNYETMRQRQKQAESQETLLDRQMAGNLELLDGPSLPLTPESRRIWWIPGGAAAGLLGGCLLAWLADLRRRRFA